MSEQILRFSLCPAGAARVLKLAVLSLVVAGCGSAPKPVAETQPLVEYEPLKDLGQKVQLALGVHLSIPADFKLTDSFDPHYALTFVEQEGGRVYKRGVSVGGLRRARTLYEHSVGEIAWSPDGTKIYDYSGGQIFEFDIPLERRKDLTNYRMRPIVNVPDYAPYGSPTRFYYDRSHQQLVYLAFNSSKRGARLAALSITNPEETILIDEKHLANTHYDCSFDIAPNRFYLREHSALSIWSWAGKKIATTPLRENEIGDVVLSPDRQWLIVEHAREARTESWIRKGFDLFDTRTRELLPQLDWGWQFRWSPDSRQIAFLNKDNEIWLFDVETKASRQLVACDRSVSQGYAPYTATPAWSRDGRMLSAGISTYLGRPHTFAYHTLTIDFAEKKICHVPRYWIDLSWAPDAKVFRK